MEHGDDYDIMRCNCSALIGYAHPKAHHAAEWKCRGFGKQESSNNSIVFE